jgi:hypothetical protein
MKGGDGFENPHFQDIFNKNKIQDFSVLKNYE